MTKDDIYNGKFIAVNHLRHVFIQSSRMLYSCWDGYHGKHMVIFTQPFCNLVNHVTLFRAIARDPELFEEPNKFNPERYLPYFDKSVPHDPAQLPLEPNEFAFGFGRRWASYWDMQQSSHYKFRNCSICAGMHYAETMFLISIARVLSTFDITKAKDTNGSEITPELKFNSSIVR